MNNVKPRQLMKGDKYAIDMLSMPDDDSSV